MSNRDRILVAVLASVVAVAGFWFLALKPKRAEVSQASARAAEAQSTLTAANQALATATSARASFETDYATIAHLGKAVPDDDDAASLVYQIETAARKAGIDFRSLMVGGSGAAPAPAPATTTPAKGSSSSSSGSGSSSTPATGSSSSPATGTSTPSTSASTGTTAGAATGTSTLAPGVVAGSDGMNRLPFTFIFDGDYFDLTKLLDLLRSFTTADGSAVTVRGRLMTVESVNLEEGRAGFPQLKATVNATAYLASQPITLPGGANAPAQSSGAVPQTTTAPSTQAAGTKSSLPTATAIPGAVK